MASRDYTRHTVSSTAPAIARAGDEYYNPTTNTLYKAIDYNGTTVQWEATPLSINGVDYANTTWNGNPIQMAYAPPITKLQTQLFGGF